MTPVSVSMRRLQATSNSPDVIHWATGTLIVSASNPTRQKTIQDRIAEAKRNTVVTISEPRSVIKRPKKPAISAPKSGRKTMALYIMAAISLSSR